MVNVRQLTRARFIAKTNLNSSSDILGREWVLLLRSMHGIKADRGRELRGRERMPR